MPFAIRVTVACQESKPSLTRSCGWAGISWLTWEFVARADGFWLLPDERGWVHRPGQRLRAGRWRARPVRHGGRDAGETDLAAGQGGQVAEQAAEAAATVLVAIHPSPAPSRRSEASGRPPGRIPRSPCTGEQADLHTRPHLHQTRAA